MTPAVNRPLAEQAATLNQILRKNEAVFYFLEQAPRFALPNWYVGAGCVTQTVWNWLWERPLLEGIKDIDFVYFDGDDLSETREEEVAETVRSHFRDFPLALDIKNEARVHLWYEKEFGYPIAAYRSTEDAINSWPTTATSVGVRLEDGFQVYAPFGLNDLFGGVVRPNKAQITEKIYLDKAERWKRHWPGLKIIPWSQ
jgi:uncharacterized protein